MDLILDIRGALLVGMKTCDVPPNEEYLEPANHDPGTSLGLEGMTYRSMTSSSTCSQLKEYLM
jgi:hypothetical protein